MKSFRLWNRSDYQNRSDDQHRSNYKEHLLLGMSEERLSNMTENGTALGLLLETVLQTTREVASEIIDNGTSSWLPAQCTAEGRRHLWGRELRVPGGRGRHQYNNQSTPKHRFVSTLTGPNLLSAKSVDGSEETGAGLLPGAGILLRAGCDEPINRSSTNDFQPIIGPLKRRRLIFQTLNRSWPTSNTSCGGAGGSTTRFVAYKIIKNEIWESVNNNNNLLFCQRGQHIVLNIYRK